MEHLTNHLNEQITIIAIVAVLFLLYFLADNKKQKIKQTEYERGYKAACERIKNGKDPETLYDESLSDLEENMFLKGWQDACRNCIISKLYNPE